MKNTLKNKDLTDASIVLQISPQQKLRSSWHFMWLGLLTTILGGWWVGLGFCRIKANSAQ